MLLSEKAFSAGIEKEKGGVNEKREEVERGMTCQIFLPLCIAYAAAAGECNVLYMFFIQQNTRRIRKRERERETLMLVQKKRKNFFISSSSSLSFFAYEEFSSFYYFTESFIIFFMHTLTRTYNIYEECTTHSPPTNPPTHIVLLVIVLSIHAHHMRNGRKFWLLSPTHPFLPFLLFHTMENIL